MRAGTASGWQLASTTTWTLSFTHRRRSYRLRAHHHGKGAVLKALGRIAKDYLLESYVPQVTVVDGDHAAVMSDVAFTQRSSGRTLRFHIADFLRFRDGRLVEFREFMNTFEVVQQVLDRQLAV